MDQWTNGPMDLVSADGGPNSSDPPDLGSDGGMQAMFTSEKYYLGLHLIRI